MVKKLGNVFLWFCAATVIAQVVVLMLSFFKGNIHQDTLVKMVATLNGMDIEGDKLRNALTQTINVPTPSREEVIAAKAQESLELDQRQRSLNRFKEQIDSQQSKLQADMKDFEARRLAFNEAVERQTKNQNDQTLGEVQKIIELLTPEQASAQLIKMTENASFEDVVAIVKALPDDKRTKILRELAQANPEKFREVLGKIRDGVGMMQTASEDKSSKSPE